jgi:kynureninase
MDTSLTYAEQLDREDPLASMLDRFIVPVHNGEAQTYLLGNSLGLQPKATKARIQQVLDTWSQYGVEGFFMGDDPWMKYHDHLTGPLSTIVGALPHEVTVMNQLTVNLHLMLVSFYRPSGSKKKILCEQKAFPSDQYMLETFVKHMGMDPDEVILEVSPRDGEDTIRDEDVLLAIEKHQDELALVFWGGLNYYTGQVFDMEAIASKARSLDIPAGFDLAHAAGNIRLHLHQWDADFACWCSYKYLNSGPGAVGGVFIHERHHHDTTLHRLAGWWGYDKETRFLMEKGFKPVQSAEGWQLSTPSMLLYACHLAALEEVQLAGWDNILGKQQQMKNYLWNLLEDLQQSAPSGHLRILTPRDWRGCQVSIFLAKDGRKIYDALMDQGIIIDWREPNVIRLAPVPLYNTFADIWRFYNAIKSLL